ncbi:MAG: 4Fe-4S dicluster domain-containing protein [Planctomycetes bacterium]|nr:4Fe-4S dicluster domain-containing protein [Planctomycetota bacterium]
MLDKIIRQADLLTLVDDMARKCRIIGPVAHSVPGCDPPVRHFYEEVERAAQLDLYFNYCVYSPKRFLFPATETLFNFDRSKGGFVAEPVFEHRPKAFVGVHPCDIHAIRLLDRVFSQDERDEHYLRRRESTLIIGLDCPRPCTDGVFCRDMGTNHAEEGFDVMLYPLDGEGGERRYGVVFGSKEGREWLLYSHRGESPSVADERGLEQYQQAKEGAFAHALTTRVDDLPALLERSYDSLLWEATARRCYSCGSCNLTCPTCYCFNVYDDLDVSLTTGRREREWDGCQLSEFALVAGDHNFRPKPASRLRHRIYRKAKWVRERSGLAGCVGCARCDRACTAKINSVEIYNQLAEEV